MIKIIGILLVAFFLFATGGGSAVLATEIRMEMRMPEGVYFLPVVLDASTGRSTMRIVDFILDTGAAYITVPESTLRGVSKSFVGKDVLFLGGGTRLTISRYKVAAIEIGGCRLANVEITATSGVTIPWLGQTLLRRVEPYTISDGGFRFTCPTQ